MRRALLATAVVLAILVDGFFALVNFYPVAPPPRRGPRRTVLVSLDPAQARWLQESLIAEFNAEHNTDVALFTVDEERLLDAVAAAPPEMVLAALPRARAGEALRRKLVRPFDEIAPADRLDEALAGVSAEAVESARVDGKLRFLPRAALLDVAVYRVSRVRDAVRNWTVLRREIDDALRAAGGRGLPPGYQLELDPEQWDSLDRFVIGYFWAHRRYRGEHARGRIAHRVGDVLDAQLDLVEGVRRAGANNADLARTDSQAARDYFGWESLYRRHGLFADAMLGAAPLDDDGILDGLRQGELFMATVTQMEAFTLHGGAHPGSPPQVDDPDDLGFAPLGRISSLESDANGRPLRAGRRGSLREEWVWAVPSHAVDPDLAVELAAFLWQRENHFRECQALGTLPLRTDVQRERSSLFRLIWMDDVLDAAFAERDESAAPPESLGAGLGSTYARLWRSLVAERGAEGLSPSALAERLRSPPPAPPAKPPAASAQAVPRPVALDGGMTEEADQDRPPAIDEEFWRGRAEVEKRP
jgi:hypothetical protein